MPRKKKYHPLDNLPPQPHMRASAFIDSDAAIKGPVLEKSIAVMSSSGSNFLNAKPSIDAQLNRTSVQCVASDMEALEHQAYAGMFHTEYHSNVITSSEGVEIEVGGSFNVRNTPRQQLEARREVLLRLEEQLND